MQLCSVIDDPEGVCLECELMAGGELLDRIGEANMRSEEEIRVICSQIAAGLACERRRRRTQRWFWPAHADAQPTGCVVAADLHLEHKVAHRDIKSPNILCEHERLSEKGCVK